MNGTSSAAIEDSVSTRVQINVLYATIIPIIIVIGSMLNLTTILAFWKMPSLRDKPSDLLILNLSFADLITSMVFLPLASSVYITPGYWPLGEIGCRITTSIMNTTIHGSLFALIAISLDRFLLVYVEYPKYIKMQSYPRIYVTITIGWVLALASVVIEQGLWGYAKEIDATAALIPFDKYCLTPPRRIRWFSLSFFTTLFFVPVMTVCGLSIAFLWQLMKRLEKSKGSGSKAVARSISTAQVEMPTCKIDNGSNSSKIGTRDSKKLQFTTKENTSNQTRNLYIKPAVTLIGLVLSMAIYEMANN
ncbi:allatostatin-A receptor-like [Amphiura filiformis]|uniref:allatostatin-A receptor-like n=1 Tax=Amphiura filiformis TaxID=82378 RepID=UPI003B223E17